MGNYSRPQRPAEKIINFTNLKGINLSSAPSMLDPSHSPYLLNAIPNKTGHPVKRYGYEKILTADAKINGCFFLNTATDKHVLLHAGTVLYSWDVETNVLTSLYTGLADARSTAFQMNTRLWLLDGKKMLCYAEFDPTGAPGVFTVDAVDNFAYVPTTAIAREPSGGGERLDNINLLCDQRINEFAGTAGDTVYVLDAVGDIDSVDLAEKLNGSGGWDVISSSGYSATLTAPASVSFTGAPGVSPVTGEDNIRITFSKAVQANKDSINQCNIQVLYGLGNHNRAFISGNEDEKNADYRCVINDPSYFEDIGYALVGQDNTAIMGYLKVGEYLTIVKESNAQDSTIFLRAGSLSTDGDVEFTIKQGAGTGVGAVSKYGFASLVNDLLFLSKDGDFAIITDAISAEKNVRRRSSAVDLSLTGETGLDEAVTAVFDGRLYICVNNHCYVADGNQRVYSKNEDFEYEWYYWNNINARVLFVLNDRLFFGTEDGEIMRFYNSEETSSYNDDGTAIEFIWDSPEVDFDTMLREKTIARLAVKLRRYAKSSIEIYIKDDGVFELVDEETFISSGFAALDFGAWSFLPLSDSSISAYKAVFKHLSYTQFRVRNAELNQPFGLYALSAKFEVKGNIK